MARDDYPDKGYPWADFLHHRLRALRWLVNDEGKTLEQAEVILSMDRGQARAILLACPRDPVAVALANAPIGEPLTADEQASLDEVGCAKSN
jgi:hypothetical protein